MSDEPVTHLASQRVAVEAMIRAAFAGVTREGGTSWTESMIIDDLGDDAACERARRSDREPNWDALIDDPDWFDDPGSGGFNFLDPVGYRYYLAPKMVRCLRRDQDDEFFCYALSVDSELRREQISLLNPLQRGAVAAFVRYMVARFESRSTLDGLRGWKNCYRSFWRSCDRGDSMDQVREGQARPT